MGLNFGFGRTKNDLKCNMGFYDGGSLETQTHQLLPCFFPGQNCASKPIVPHNVMGRRSVSSRATSTPHFQQESAKARAVASHVLQELLHVHCVRDNRLVCQQIFIQPLKICAMLLRESCQSRPNIWSMSQKGTQHIHTFLFRRQ